MKVELTKREETAALKKALNEKQEDHDYGIYDKVMYRDLELGDSVRPVSPMRGYTRQNYEGFKEILDKHNWGFNITPSDGYIQISSGSNKMFYKQKEKGPVFLAFAQERVRHEAFQEPLIKAIEKQLKIDHNISFDMLREASISFDVSLGSYRDLDNRMKVRLQYIYEYPIYNSIGFLESSQFPHLIQGIAFSYLNKVNYRGKHNVG